MNSQPYVKPYSPCKVEHKLCDPRTELPPDHLVYFIIDVMDQLDLTPFYNPYINNTTGPRPYDPKMLLSILIYAYCVGVHSSRKIQNLLYENVAFRILCAGHRPNFRTISDFRRRHLEDFNHLFVEILKIAQETGQLELGSIAIDGTKIYANASKLKNREVRGTSDFTPEEVSDLVDCVVDRAKQMDETENRDQGKNSHGHIKADHMKKAIDQSQDRVEEIKKAREKLSKAKSRVTSEELHSSVSEEKSDKTTVVTDQEDTSSGSRVSKTKEVASQRETTKTKKKKKSNNKKINLTDPDSRIMRTATSGFQQSYNAQIAVDKETQLIVGASVNQQHNDQGLLHPMIDSTILATGETPEDVRADEGYSNEKDLQLLEDRQIEGYVATRKNVDVKKHPATGRMLKRLSEPAGRERYKCRAWMGEAPFAWIKRRRGFTQFSVRSLNKVQGEWNLVCATQNLVKMFAMHLA